MSSALLLPVNRPCRPRKAARPAASRVVSLYPRRINEEPSHRATRRGVSSVRLKPRLFFSFSPISVAVTSVYGSNMRRHSIYSCSFFFFFCRSYRVAVQDDKSRLHPLERSQTAGGRRYGKTMLGEGPLISNVVAMCVTNCKLPLLPAEMTINRDVTVRWLFAGAFISKGKKKFSHDLLHVSGYPFREHWCLATTFLQPIKFVLKLTQVTR